MTKFKPYYNAVRYLETLACSQHDKAYMKTHSAHPEQYLERTREFINRLGKLHPGFKYIHVAGTSGKGSTVSYLHNILYKSGYKVGSFTSPYCTTSIEKIKVDDKLIDPLVFAELVDKAKPIIKQMDDNYEYGRPSYFEIFFGIAILYFKKMKCDYVILEVGCGGRYDAGNIIEKSISAITNIGLDHTQLLGKTLPKIAKEKAGIIKPNTHLFTTEKRKSILKIFKNICKEKNAKFHHISTDALLERLGNCKTVSAQQKNQVLASAIAKHLHIKNSIIDSAIKATQLPPCRFEIMRKRPLIILDGAHNPDKMRSVVHNLKNLTCATLYTIFAASDTKDAKTMLRVLLPRIDSIIFTKFKTPGRDSFTPEQLSRFAGKFKNKSIERGASKALKSAIKKLKPEDCLLITGSLYLTGELRKYWISENKILTNRTTCQTS